MVKQSDPAPPPAPVYGQPADAYYLKAQQQYAPQSLNVQGAPTVPTGPPGWTSGLCGCTNDYFSCCLTCLVPCVAFGQIAQKVDDDQSSCFMNGLIYAVACMLGVQCCYACLYRGKMRAKYQLPEEPCNDCCTHWCCELCALCQEYRELKNRGLDPALCEKLTCFDDLCIFSTKTNCYDGTHPTNDASNMMATRIIKQMFKNNIVWNRQN